MFNLCLRFLYELRSYKNLKLLLNMLFVSNLPGLYLFHARRAVINKNSFQKLHAVFGI